MSVFQNLFHHPAFAKTDPLGDGLAEEIAAEQNDPLSLEFQAEIDGQALEQAWQNAVNDLHNDPDWIDFSED